MSEESVWLHSNRALAYIESTIDVNPPISDDVVTDMDVPNNTNDIK